MRSVTDFDDDPPGDLAHPCPRNLCFPNAHHPVVSVQDDVPSNSNRLSPPNCSGGEEIPTEIDPVTDLYPMVPCHWKDALRTRYGEAPETGFLFPCGQFVVVL